MNTYVLGGPFGDSGSEEPVEEQGLVIDWEDRSEADLDAMGVARALTEPITPFAGGERRRWRARWSGGSCWGCSRRDVVTRANQIRRAPP